MLMIWARAKSTYGKPQNTLPGTTTEVSLYWASFVASRSKCNRTTSSTKRQCSCSASWLSYYNADTTLIAVIYLIHTWDWGRRGYLSVFHRGYRWGFPETSTSASPTEDMSVELGALPTARQKIVLVGNLRGSSSISDVSGWMSQSIR